MLCVVLNLILIPLMGIAGAAATSSITYVLALCMWLIFYLRESDFSLSEMRPTWKDTVFVWQSLASIARIGWGKIRRVVSKPTPVLESGEEHLTEHIE